MFNHTVTIYNRYKDGDYKYKRTVLNGVHWESGEGIKLGSKSMQTSNDTSLVVPFSIKNYSRYKNPKDFKKAPMDDVWTLQGEDIVVKGEVDIEIISIADLKDCYDVKTIATVHVVDYACSALNNFTVDLK